ncbi:conserved hypothetical protein [Vibrio chagasii]|nr:conserved hypothetical protein [Vibrio chagasii]CAH7031213.1 conserved hypothetical protein [Vibrio chagasii]
MNKFLIVALVTATSISGCKSIPTSATDTLSEPHGNGALAIATNISKHDSTYPCVTFSFDIQEKIDGKLVDSEPQTLRVFVYEDTKYALFDDIKPGNYVLTQFRCNMRRGLVANDGKSFLSLDLETEHTIKANTITMSSNFIHATQDEDRSFALHVGFWQPDDAVYFQNLLTTEVSNKWEVSGFGG